MRGICFANFTPRLARCSSFHSTAAPSVMRHMHLPKLFIAFTLLAHAACALGSEESAKRFLQSQSWAGASTPREVNVLWGVVGDLNDDGVPDYAAVVDVRGEEGAEAEERLVVLAGAGDESYKLISQLNRASQNLKNGWPCLETDESLKSAGNMDANKYGLITINPSAQGSVGEGLLVLGHEAVHYRDYRLNDVNWSQYDTQTELNAFAWEQANYKTFLPESLHKWYSDDLNKNIRSVNNGTYGH